MEEKKQKKVVAEQKKVVAEHKIGEVDIKPKKPRMTKIAKQEEVERLRKLIQEGKLGEDSIGNIRLLLKYQKSLEKAGSSKVKFSAVTQLDPS